jgi:hypothetical protein
LNKKRMTNHYYKMTTESTKNTKFMACMVQYNRQLLCPGAFEGVLQLGLVATSGVNHTCPFASTNSLMLPFYMRTCFSHLHIGLVCIGSFVPLNSPHFVMVICCKRFLVEFPSSHLFVVLKSIIKQSEEVNG